MVKNLLDKIGAIRNKKVTAYGIRIGILLPFVALFLGISAVASGARVEAWSLMFIFVDLVVEYLSEKKKDNHYFYGE
jgi:hypothetical protein